MASNSVTAFLALLPWGLRVSSPGNPPEPQDTSHGHVLASPIVIIKGFQEQEGLKHCLFIPTRSGKTRTPNFMAEWVFISRDEGAPSGGTSGLLSQCSGLIKLPSCSLNTVEEGVHWAD